MATSSFTDVAGNELLYIVYNLMFFKIKIFWNK